MMVAFDIGVIGTSKSNRVFQVHPREKPACRSLSGRDHCPRFVAIKKPDHPMALDLEKFASDKNKKLKIAVDVLSVAFITFELSITSIWNHYHPSNRTIEGRITPDTKLLLAAFIPSLFGFLWLIFRYADRMNRRFPFFLKPTFQIPFLMCVPIVAILLRLLWG
jgi:hypothetical protein